MEDQMKAVEETRAIKGLASDAHHHAMNYHGMLDPITKAHAREQAISMLTQIEQHVRTALAALGT